MKKISFWSKYHNCSVQFTYKIIFKNLESMFLVGAGAVILPRLRLRFEEKILPDEQEMYHAKSDGP